MKKLTAFLMSMLLACSLTACSGTPTVQEGSLTSADSQVSNQTSDTSKVSEQTSDVVKASDTTADNSESEPEDVSGPADSTGKKTLIVYYSASGNTESAANYIAAATGGDTFELVPKNEYSDADLNYRDNDSRVVYEHDHPEARDIELLKDTVDNWDEYDTVFIGYPIWWQIAAWPVDRFIKANDFTGKIVIPFCTSVSSGLGDSGKLLEEMAGTGEWLEGQRFSYGVSEQTVKDWVESLNLEN